MAEIISAMREMAEREETKFRESCNENTQIIETNKTNMHMNKLFNYKSCPNISVAHAR